MSAPGTRSWGTILQALQKRLVRDRVSLSAGSLAYHWFLAIFPAVIALIGFITIAHLGSGSIAHLTHGIDAALPTGVAGVFNAAVLAASNRTSGSGVAVTLGILVALWSSSSGMAALQQALDIAFEVPVDRSFLSRRVRAAPLMLATAILGGSGAALIVFGAPIGSAISGHVGLHGLGFVVVWTIVRWAVTIVVVSLLFSSYYYFGPNRTTPTWQWVSPGGVLATFVFLGASLGFSYYATAFGSYGRTYGSFAGVAILIFWLYLSALAILTGGELNAELDPARLPSGPGGVGNDELVPAGPT